MNCMQKNLSVLKEKLSKRDSKIFLIGAVAGTVSRTLTAPMERIKIIQQSNHYYDKQTSFFQNLSIIIKNEGFFGLFRGNLTTVAKTCPSMAIEFYVYDLFRRKWLSGKQLNATNSLAIGVLGGIISSTLTYPLDLLRTILSQQKTTSEFEGCWKSLQGIWGQFGISGLSKGLGLNCISYAPAVAINLTVFNLLKNLVNGVKEGVEQTGLSNQWTLVLGCVSGAVSGIAIHPLDLLKKRMQIQVLNKSKYEQQCLMAIIREIWYQKGIKGFYSGVGASVAKIAPATAIAQFVNSWLKEACGVTKKNLH